MERVLTGGRVLRLALLLVSVGLVGCADTKAEPTEAAGGCTPDRGMYDATTAAQITNHCGKCHGAKPDFGANVTLTGGYDSLLAGETGKRLVDRMAVRLSEKTMPPVGQPPIDHVSLDTLTEWASCGQKHPDETKGITVDRPVFTSPAAPPAGTESFDLRADDFAVAKDTIDLYQCFTFEAPVSEDRFLQRIEAVMDRSEVVHHIVLLKDPKQDFAVGRKTCAQMPKGALYLYAWAPGGGAVQFPEGGMRIQKGEHYVLQVHYNNGAALDNVVDKSGVRIWHGPTVGTEYGMIAPGPSLFFIPPQSTTSATGNCVFQEKTRLLAGMPHMHVLGSAFDAAVVHPDGTRTGLIHLTGWSFEMQPFYLFDTTLEPGDRLETKCTWRNDGKEGVQTGESTKDEMCFLFSFVSPTPKKMYCNEFVVEANPDVPYKPGTCAGVDANPQPGVNSVKPFLGDPPTLTGGPLPTARWELTSAYLVLPPMAGTQLNVEKSLQISRGQAWTSEGRLNVDAVMRLVIAMNTGAALDTVDTVAKSGKLTPGATPGEATWTPDCGSDAAEDILYGVTGDVLTVQVTKHLAQFAVPAVYTFTRK